MRTVLSLLLLAALSMGALAGDIQVGATMHLKANSISFEQADQLAKWHDMKKKSMPKAFADYQEKKLHARDAWQFLDVIDVKVLRYDPAKAQVEVQMKTTGRLSDTTWFVDPTALAP
jgi:hypothetical protein